MSYQATLNVCVFDNNGQVIVDGNGNSIAQADPDPRYQGSDPPATTVGPDGCVSFVLTDLSGSTSYDVNACCVGYTPQSQRVTFSSPSIKSVTFYLNPV
ncbi:MAG: hypothetical protein IT364_16220 [Candidatus Hydrogenedentes bacterium]|nr:hypothetical protein [Candidatus Hydrogenedentota bacterium]